MRRSIIRRILRSLRQLGWVLGIGSAAAFSAGCQNPVMLRRSCDQVVERRDASCVMDKLELSSQVFFLKYDLETCKGRAELCESIIMGKK